MHTYIDTHIHTDTHIYTHTKEEWPECETMKRKAQQECDHAVKYTSLGKVQFFLEREREM
jgi:hypothetical protein